MIDPHGLTHGERIRACSDEARLNFPCLLAASNSYGRLRMCAERIVEAGYVGYNSPPSEEQLVDWLREYHDNFLLFVYKASDGSLWGQWDVPKPLLGKYRRKCDLNSPAPPAEELQAFKERYTASRRKSAGKASNKIFAAFSEAPESSARSENVPEISEYFENAEVITEIPEASGNSEEIPEISEEFPHGVVVGIGVDVGVVKKQTKDMSIPAESHPKAAPPGSLAPVTKTPQAEESPPKQGEAEARAIVTHVFEYYLAQLGRKKSQYELTRKRMKKGLDALRECKRRFPDGDSAEIAMGAAVDGLLANKFLMGANDRNRRYVDWIDNLYKDVETMEKRWEDGGFDANV